MVGDRLRLTGAHLRATDEIHLRVAIAYRSLAKRNLAESQEGRTCRRRLPRAPRACEACVSRQPPQSPPHLIDPRSIERIHPRKLTLDESGRRLARTSHKCECQGRVAWSPCESTAYEDRDLA